MQVKLQKHLVVINKGKNDEKSFYAFDLVLPNGQKLRIKPNSFERNGKIESNYRELLLIADDELPFEK